MVIDIKELLLDMVEEEVLELFYGNDFENWERLLLSRRINDRITRIKQNIGFPKVKYNGDKDTRHDNIRYRNGS